MLVLPWCDPVRIHMHGISSIRWKVTNCEWTETFLTLGMISKCQTEPCWLGLGFLYLLLLSCFFWSRSSPALERTVTVNSWSLNSGLKNNKSYSSFSVSMTSISVYYISKLVLHFNLFLFLFIWWHFLVSTFVSLFHSEDDQTVEQFAQRGCEVSRLRDIQSPMHSLL